MLLFIYSMDCWFFLAFLFVYVLWIFLCLLIFILWTLVLVVIYCDFCAIWSIDHKVVINLS